MLKIEIAKISGDVRRALKDEPGLSETKMLAKLPSGFEKLIETIENHLEKTGGAAIKLGKSLYKLHEMTEIKMGELGRIIEESTKRAYSKSTITKMCRAGYNIHMNPDLETVTDLEKHYVISRLDEETIVGKFKLVGTDVKYGSLKVNEATREELSKALGFKKKKKLGTSAKVVSISGSKKNVSDWSSLTRERVLDDLKSIDADVAEELEELLTKIDGLFKKARATS